MSTFPRALENRFRPVRLLGEGGHGAVWLVVQKELDREVALKLLHGHALDQAELVGRFLAEARVTAALVHPNIVILVDHNVEDGLPWIAYEYLPGPTLSSRIRAGQITHEEALTAGLDVARALEVAHGRNVLHRDVKPDNVIADGCGGWKVTDFGIARWVSGTVKTASGVVMGTPPYMAPEMFLGEPPTAAVDLYALGVLLFEALTGRLPYDSENLARIAEDHLRAPVPNVPDVPPRLERLVRQALAKHPSERPASAGAMAEELEAILSGGGLSKGQVQRNRAASNGTQVVEVASTRRNGPDRAREASGPYRPRGTGDTNSPAALTGARKPHAAWPAALAVAALLLAVLLIWKRPVPAPAVAPRVAQVDAAADALIQKLKDAEASHASLDAERARAGAAAQERVAAQLAEVEARTRELDDIESSFDGARFEPPRRAHVAFRLAGCRWSLACWRHRLKTRADAFEAARGAWEPLKVSLLALPAALTQGGDVGGDRSWLIHAAANDLAFFARHFAGQTPCQEPPGGVLGELAALGTPVKGSAELVRRLLNVELRLGLDPRRAIDAAELAGLRDAIQALAPSVERTTRDDLARRAFNAIQHAHDQTVALAVPWPGLVRPLLRAGQSLDEARRQSLDAHRATAALSRAWIVDLPAHPVAAREPGLRLRTAALSFMLERLGEWAHGRSDSASAISADAFVHSIAPYAAAVDLEQPYATDTLPNLLWELRLLGSACAMLAGKPDASVAAAAEAARRAGGGARGVAQARLIAAFLDHGNDEARAVPLAEHLAVLKDLRKAFEGARDTTHQRELLMRDLCARVQGVLEPYLEQGANLPRAIESLRSVEAGKVFEAIAPHLADEKQALALADGLYEELAPRAGPSSIHDGWFAHTAAIGFTTWLRAERLRALQSRADTELLAATGAHIVATLLPPPDWKGARRRLNAHALALRSLLAGSRDYTEERDVALGTGLRDVYCIARSVGGGNLTAVKLPADVDSELRAHWSNVPDADPALVELVFAIFDLGWGHRDANKHKPRVARALAGATRWPKLSEVLRFQFGFQRQQAGSAPFRPDAGR